ncbi:MAG: anion-transporting ArsA/GET3 family ATPase [Hyphomicrobiaceae bacterium]|jgi:anion-transporting  ArsA/GET3 family ATPase
MNVVDLLADHRVVVCVGSGGVGKTTIAACLALHGALGGRRAMVLTIDPARRLAQSLGLTTLASGGETIDGERLKAAGLELSGSLAAGMLDQKSAWDEFIVRHAPNEELARTILDNRFYQHLSQSFAGSTEYMAMEELGRIDESGLYDLIILDTPPSGHAVDFLEAPQRLAAFLDRSVVGWLVGPSVSVGWNAWKRASRGARFLLRRVEDATGIGTLTDISDFFVAMEGLFDGIGDRTRKVQALLKAEGTAFVLVAGPEEQVLGEADRLAAKMRELSMPLKGVVMNRVHEIPPGLDPEPAAQELAGLGERLVSNGASPGAVQWLLSNMRDYLVSANAEGARREAFAADLGDEVVTTAVPEMEGDVHDLQGLSRLAHIIAQAGPI